jgi:hypothetical protein
LIVPFSINIKGWSEGDEDEVIAKDIGDDFIKRWVVARADGAGRVVDGVEVPISFNIKGWRERDEDKVIAKDIGMTSSSDGSSLAPTVLEELSSA